MSVTFLGPGRVFFGTLDGFPKRGGFPKRRGKSCVLCTSFIVFSPWGPVDLSLTTTVQCSVVFFSREDDSMDNLISLPHTLSLSERIYNNHIYVSSSSDQFKLNLHSKFCGTHGQNCRARVILNFRLKIIEMTHYHSNHLANISDTLEKRWGWWQSAKQTRCLA